MSSSSSDDVPVFSSTQDELVYWKNKSLQLKEQNRQVMSKRCFNCANGDDQEIIIKDPVKKIRYEMDPFKLFPQHCQEIILNHFNNMDVYNMTKVSEYWKLIVESDKKAAEKLKKALKMSMGSVNDHVKLIGDCDVAFKYAKFSTELIDFAYMIKFSSSLEVISLNQQRATGSFVKRSLGDTAFTQLRQMDINCFDLSELRWFSKCSFPTLNRLRLSIFRSDNESDFLTRRYSDSDHDDEPDNEILQNTLMRMPKLDHLVILSDDSWISLNGQFETSPLKTLHLSTFNQKFIMTFAETLTNLEIKKIYWKHIAIIINNLKNLKTLSVGEVYEYRNETNLIKMDAHASITNLKISKTWKFFNDLLSSLPSLSEITICSQLEKSVFFHLAHRFFSPNLKMVTCRSVEKGLMEAYDNLKITENNENLNKGIEIKIDRQLWWDNFYEMIF